MSRQTRHILTGLVIVAALLTAGKAPVGACSCVRESASCESTWTADAVFVATVLSLGPETQQERFIESFQFIERRRIIKLNVTEAFRGVGVGELDVRTSASEASCGYSFRTGGTYLVYAYRDARTGALAVSLCSRTALVQEAADDLAYLRGPFVTPSDLGVVRGIVTRQDPPSGPNQPMRQAPFPGAEIRLEGYARAYNTTSADDGAYEFRVPAGEYRVLVNVRDGVYARPGPEGRTVTVRDNRGCAVMDVAVRPDGRIAGRLLAADGRPVPFMSVELVTARQLESTSLSVSTRVLTDARGRFEFTQLDPGHYAPGLTLRRNPREGVDLAIWISPDGGGSAAKASVEPEGRVDLGDLRLPTEVSTITLSGVVVSADGTPVPGAQVRFTDPGPAMGSIGAPVTTGDDGRFSLSVIAGRSYQLVAEWFSPTLAPRRFVTARSDPFDAVGEIKPFRLVLSEVR